MLGLLVSLRPKNEVAIPPIQIAIADIQVRPKRPTEIKIGKGLGQAWLQRERSYK
jgi:hypothetical protein